jgi:4-amino-4-deoxy-L-arabinose transferase-like glycosyltransferase
LGFGLSGADGGVQLSFVIYASKRHPLAAVAVVALATHLAGTWILPLLDRDEPRFAEAAREMRQRNNFVVPQFNGSPRLDKPPLIYWCQAIAFSCLGENEFAARLPSAVAATLTAMTLFCWARRLGSPDPAAWWAAIMFTLCLQTIVHGKAAVADMLLTWFFLVASWAGWELERDDGPQAERRTWWWLFFVAPAFGFLTKGPVAWLPIVPVLIRHWREPRGSRRNLKLLPGVAVTLGIVAIWAVPALVQTNGGFFSLSIGRHVIERSLHPLEGHGATSLLGYAATLPFYFVTVFASFFPWSLSLVRTVRARAHWDGGDRYLAGAVLVVFVVFTPLRTKLPHYILPALPLLSLLVAREWFRSGLPQGTLWRRAISMGALNLLMAFVAFPILSQFSPAKELLRASSHVELNDMRIAAVDFQEPSLVWYFRSKSRHQIAVIGERDAPKFLAAEGPRALIIPASRAQEVAAGAGVPLERIESSGFNIAKGHRTRLTMLVKH